MKIGILKADSVLEQFQIDFGEYPEMVSRALSAATQLEGDDTLEFIAFDVEHGQYIDIGGREWRALIGHGHAPEHVCLYMRIPLHRGAPISMGVHLQWDTLI